MYSYVFEFYKPGKKIYNKSEIERTINYFKDTGYEVENNFKLFSDVTDISVRISKSDFNFGFYLYPSREESHGAIAELTISQEQFEKDREEAKNLMIELASGIFLGIEPLFAWGDHELEIGRLEEYLRFDKITALAWVNFFSKELVERLGGIEQVVLFPDEVKSYEGKEWKFSSVLTSPLPTEPIPERLMLECQSRYPGVTLRR